MRIDSIKINGFGKIQDSEIEFKDGINIIYGENEAGKSTILKFISSMLYGVSKNKNGKSISDFDKYKPWNNEEFSGKIKYTLDDESEFEVFRDFKKKNPVIYNEFGKDISKEFCIDKSKGISYFEEQTGIDEPTFFKTVAIEQNDVKLNKLDSNSLVQKMSNLVSTGDDNISFQKSLDKLNKMQTENIGNDRTKQRPLNIVNENIEKLKSDKKKVNCEIKNSSDNSDKKIELNSKMSEEKTKKDFLKEVKELDILEKLNDSKLEMENNSLEECFFRVNELRDKMNENTGGRKRIKTKFNKPLFSIIFACLVAIDVIIYIILKNIIVSLVSVIPPIGIMIYMIKKNFEIQKEFDKNDSYIKKEYENALQNYEKKKKEVESLSKYFAQNINKMQKEITDRYKKNVSTRFIEEIFNKKFKIDDEIELNQSNINEIDVQIRLLETEKVNVDEKLQRLTRIEEDLEEQKNIKEELISLNESYNLAKECLEMAYNEVKHNISPRFQEKLCEIIYNITDGKYKKVIVNDENIISVEVQNGSYMPIELLSVGTIDEMFLALRLSALNDISKENIPILFDETFAYFDNNRLKNVLLYLQDQNYDSQILIFTCTNREIMALNELKIEYNLITLEK